MASALEIHSVTVRVVRILPADTGYKTPCAFTPLK